MSDNSITRKETGPRMSKIVIHNGTVYLAGQVPQDFNADITVQTQQTLANVDALLNEAGSSRQHILSTTIYLSDMREFADMNAVWDAWLPEGHTPARACVQAPMAHPDIRVEICVIAAVK